MYDIINGDSSIILQEMVNKKHKTDIIITDPPYDFTESTKEYYHNLFLQLSRHGVIVFSPPENPWIFPADQYGYWIKPISTKNTSRRYSRFVECIYFYKTDIWNIDRHWSQYTNVFNDIVVDASLHPFAKPVSLLERLVLNHTNKGMTVLDPFCGIGSEGIAAVRNYRDYVGIEKESNYCDTARSLLKAVDRYGL